MLTRYLIRHGLSQSNVGMPTLHPEIVELTRLGYEQAECIARFLETQASPDLIVNSSYKRSRQTTEPTLYRFPTVRHEEWQVQEFTYISSWHNEPSTLEERRPMVEAYWDMAEPALVDGPGSESFEQFIARVNEANALLMHRRENTVAMFSHELFICAFVWLLQNKQSTRKLDQEDMRNFRRFHLSHRVSNGAIIRLELDDNHVWRVCETITSHIDELQKVPAGKVMSTI